MTFSLSKRNFSAKLAKAWRASVYVRILDVMISAYHPETITQNINKCNAHLFENTYVRQKMFRHFDEYHERLKDVPA